MDLICPVCNGLMEIDFRCRQCQKKMNDLGRIEDFYLPYSPYEEQDDLAALQESDLFCIHLLFCPNCKLDQRCNISLKEF